MQKCRYCKYSRWNKETLQIECDLGIYIDSLYDVKYKRLIRINCDDFKKRKNKK